jgi:hypothetical protein
MLWINGTKIWYVASEFLMANIQFLRKCLTQQNKVLTEAIEDIKSTNQGTDISEEEIR